MYIWNLGKRTTHWHNSFQVQQMAGDAAPSRGNDRAQAFPPTSHRTSHRLPLSIHKQSTKQELGHFAGKRIPRQLSRFSTIFDVQRKKKKPCKMQVLALQYWVHSLWFTRLSCDSLVRAALSSLTASDTGTATFIGKQGCKALLCGGRISTYQLRLLLDGVSQEIVKFLFWNFT